MCRQWRQSKWLVAQDQRLTEPRSEPRHDRPDARRAILLHRRRGEGVDLVDRRVDVRRDPHAFVLGVDDRGGDDAPIRPQPFDQLARRHVGELHGSDRARVRGIEVGVDSHLRVRREPASPTGCAGSAAAPPCARCRCPDGTPALRRSRCDWRPGACRSLRTSGCPPSSRRRPASAATAPGCSRAARRESPCRSARAATCAGWCRSSRSRDPRPCRGSARRRGRRRRWS